MNTEDPLHKIAQSLANLENLYSESLRRQEEQLKQYEERQKEFDERQKKWDKRDDNWEKYGLYSRNPWLQPNQIAYFFIATAMLILSIIAFSRR